jgi:hypothetical protein
VWPARGLYQVTGVEIHAMHTLTEAAVLVPNGVICLISALQIHELTLHMPSTVWMAIDRTAWLPKIAAPRICFVRFSTSQLTDGVTHQMIDGVNVTVTKPAGTIVDCFRYRSKVGLDVAMEGLREASGEACSELTIFGALRRPCGPGPCCDPMSRRWCPMGIERRNMGASVRAPAIVDDRRTFEGCRRAYWQVKERRQSVHLRGAPAWPSPPRQEARCGTCLW